MLHNSRRAGILLINVLWICVIFLTGYAGEANSRSFDIYPLSQLKRGMEGVGRTVFYGTQVDDFNVRVVDVVESHMVEESYFIIEVVDERVRRSGGISAGMSGSPIMIQGKIAGALAYSWQARDNMVGLVTPIEAMVKLWEKPRDISFVQAWSPQSVLLVLGLDGRGGEHLRKNVSWREVVMLPHVSPYRVRFEADEAELIPGSAVGVQLVKGDVDIVSIGTLTAREEDRFLAFGHSFLHRGRSNFFLSSVFVNYSVEGKEFPFKVGTPIKPVGIVDEDRSAGIAGRFNIYPRTTHCRIVVTKDEENISRTFDLDIVRDENIIMEFLPGIVLDAIDRVLDSQIPGSVRVAIDFRGKPTGFHHEYFWVSHFDVASLTANNLGKITEDVFRNPFFELEAEHIDIHVMVIPDIREAFFRSLELPPEGERGEDLTGSIGIHLYREGSKNIDFTIPIPPDFPLGEAEVNVRGLASAPLSAMITPTDFESYLEERVKEMKTNGFEVEVRSLSEPFSQEAGRGYFSQRFSLPFVLDGTYSGILMIGD